MNVIHKVLIQSGSNYNSFLEKDLFIFEPPYFVKKDAMIQFFIESLFDQRNKDIYNVKMVLDSTSEIHSSNIKYYGHGLHNK